MNLPAPKVPGAAAIRGAAPPRPPPATRIPAGLMPTPRMPGGATAPPGAAAARLGPPTRTASLKDLAFVDLMTKKAAAAVRKPAGMLTREAAEAALTETSSAFSSASLRSMRPVARDGNVYEVVARYPGAIDLCIEGATQGEVLVSRVRDAAFVGGLGVDGEIGIIGLELVGISPERFALAPAERPGGLHAALARLGTTAPREAFPLYLHLRERQKAAPAPGAAPRSKSPPPPPLPLERWQLQQVIVVTNREPIVVDGVAKFSPVLTDARAASDFPSDACDAGLYWGLATLAKKVRHREPDAEAPAAKPGGAEPDDDDAAPSIADWSFVGWEPLARAAALGRVSAACAASVGAEADCLVYVHGFNTNLQFAARSAALYAAAFGRPNVVVFAWPSNPPLPRDWAISAVLSVAERNYTAAEQMMQRSVPALERATTLLRAALPATSRMHWKAHSMGCYLALSAVERLARAQAAAALYDRVILDAPDAPTWFFVDTVRAAAHANVRFLHLFNPRDEAVEISRQRRGLDWPAPGSGPVSGGQPGVEAVDCSAAQATYGYHDYGRLDAALLCDQARFLAGVRAEDRGLNYAAPGVYTLPGQAA